MVEVDLSTCGRIFKFIRTILVIFFFYNIDIIYVSAY